MERITYPNFPGSGARMIEWADLFAYHNGDPNATPRSFANGNGGQFTLDAGESTDSFDTKNIPAGKYTLITRSTYGSGPHAILTVTQNGRTLDIGPGESCYFKIRRGDDVKLSSRTGGTFTVTCNGNY